MAYLAIIPTFHFVLSLPIFGAALTPPVSRGFGIVVGTIFVPLILLLSTAYIARQSISTVMSREPLFLHVQHLVVGVRTRPCTRVVLIYKEH